MSAREIIDLTRRLLDAITNSDWRGYESLCADDLTAAVGKIAELIGRIVDAQCVLGDLADTSDEPGLQPDCSVVEVINPGLPNEEERLLQACDNTADPQASSNLPCFHMFDNPTDCSAYPTQLGVEVFYAEGIVVPPFTRAEVSCVGVSPLED